MSNTELVSHNATKIRKLFKQFSPKNTFSPTHIEGGQRGVKERLLKAKWKRSDIRAALHRSWDELDDNEKSAACLFEQYRIRLAILTIIYPYLKRLNIKFLSVTIVSRRWRSTGNDVDSSDISPIRRKAQDGYENLRALGTRPVIFGTIELSGLQNLNKRLFWEPHMHLLIGGATKAQVKDAFKIRASKAEIKEYRPVVIRPIEGEIKKNLAYVCKFKPNLRKKYTGAAGIEKSGKAKLVGQKRSQWTSWMAKHPMREMIIHHGIPRETIQTAIEVELGELIDALP